MYSTNQQEIKGNLAKLLATENLVVESKKVPTASFDVDSRVLVLPLWDKASNVVYDMLVGHEVGHALFTPNQDLDSECPRDYVNVIEDARIEKLMKRKYPGLKKSFAGGYKELNNDDFFGIAGEDLSTFTLIDRINLHFKCGADALIPFEEDEKVFVQRTEDVETFEEVLKIAKDVYSLQQKKNEEESHPMFDNSGEEDEDFTPQDSSQQQGESDSEGNEDSDNEDFKVTRSTSSPDQDLLDQLEDAMYEEGDSDGYGGDNDGDIVRTQEEFERKSERLSSESYNDATYVEIPDTVPLDRHIADWTDVHDWIDQVNVDTVAAGHYDEVDREYRDFRQSSQKEVNYLVKEFECRKSADAYARAGVAKTGVLDTSKLHTYKYNEDLFKKITVVPDGKNHGMIFLLDWSGSMAYEILPTVKQLIKLTSFCKKVQIPFEVYAFTNEWVIAQRAIDNGGEYDFGTRYYGEYSEHEGIEKNKIFIDPRFFHLVNFISSRSNAREYERQCKNLFREANYYHRRGGYVHYSSTPGLGLSGTPLNEGIILLNYIIPNFKRDNDLQKVNVCILTDGEANPSAYGAAVHYTDEDEKIRPRRCDYKVVLRDRKTGRVYGNFAYQEETNIFIQQLQDRFPEVNVLGFRILAGNQLSNFVHRFARNVFYDDVQKQWRKEKSAIIPNPVSYTALYALSNKDMDEEAVLDVNEGAAKAEISRAFKKMIKSKATSKKILNSFIDYVC